MPKTLLLIFVLSALLFGKEALYKMSDCFGKTRYVNFDPNSIVSIEPAKCSDKNGIKVFQLIVKRSGYRSYMLNAHELSSLLNTEERLQREMKSQEIEMIRKELMLE